MSNLIHIPEPLLLVGHGQETEDPRDGLTLFGPLDQAKPYGVKAGVIGTRRGISAFRHWVERVQGPIFNQPPSLGRPPFPGFEAAFHTVWDPEPFLSLELTDEEIDRDLYLDDVHQRVFRTVSVFADRLIRAKREEESKPELWFVIVPDRVWKYCRPKSVVEPALRQEAERRFGSPRRARDFYGQGALFAERQHDATPYVHEEQFHHQLKARLLNEFLLTQIVKESTITAPDAPHPEGVDSRSLARQSEIAWNLSTGVFYKVGGRPWKVAGIRDGVCYLGLVFKTDETTANTRHACCAAQMFLDSGDGVVFKGAVGPWYSPEKREFHLSRSAAAELMELCLGSYKAKVGSQPKEVFVHGRVRFNDEEWAGFLDAVSPGTSIVGVRIRPESNFKLFRKGLNPVLRGIAHIRGRRSGHLWTKGWTPRLQTYPGREVPNPILVEICAGEAPIDVVLRDILALTKLNYNTCIFGDGLPITLKFANAVGDILTAAPIKGVPPLPFSHYI